MPLRKRETSHALFEDAVNRIKEAHAIQNVVPDIPKSVDNLFGWGLPGRVVVVVD